jgi:hypothetical protein
MIAGHHVGTYLTIACFLDGVIAFYELWSSGDALGEHLGQPPCRLF